MESLIIDVPVSSANESPLKDWRLKYQDGTISKTDFIEFFKKKSRLFFEHHYENQTEQNKRSLKCKFREDAAKEIIIDELLAFMLGDNPNKLLKELEKEGNAASICGKVFKSGEPTYSCRECGMDHTCVLCVSCFKQSAHRFHKYKMSMSGGGGCCDCGDEEAWKKDFYCEEHARGKNSPVPVTIITDIIKERCEIVFIAILTFCVRYFEIESNASFECLDFDDDDAEQCFCTILYNDESHTFEQVIQTLTKIVKSPQKDANEIVSSIDREGRAVVKCDVFNECVLLKEAIEKQSVTSALPSTSRANQSLRVSVLHISKVACQQFALQLLTWFQEFLVRHRIFREIFANIILEKKSNGQLVPYHISKILDNDVKLWKMARACWHRLLISGMLMEYEHKMSLAQAFSRHYASIMQDFIRDDHDHSYSIVSLSVQLFTVPSIAHYLIANEGIFYKLLHTFYNESVEKYLQNKTLHFSKSLSSMGYFKRSSYILYDLRYILSFKPDVWTDDLRDGFLEGCRSLLRVLNVMQGMEAFTRQTGQHMDYEPEWETAYNLHIKLASTIGFIFEWCATDSIVLTKLYQLIMRVMANNAFTVNSELIKPRTVFQHTANCIDYEVGVKPVSLHLPLSRLFAGVYLKLEKYDLSYDNIPVPVKLTPQQIMEPVLCTQVMMSQVHANMWRRNGYSLLHQIYFYRNVRCRCEMLDRDIIVLQIAASLIESNEFLVHLIHKYKLIDWLQPDFDDDDNLDDEDYTKRLDIIDDFLELLIVIIGERYMPGISNITEDDRTRKEIIQLLCIKSYSHSELNRALPESLNDTEIEAVIRSVAVFQKPINVESKGVYTLREELYDEYNMYFYHYTKEEKSRSEQVQCLRRKNKGELVCCPPPKLPRLTNSFITIVNLLQCDILIMVICEVLDKASDKEPRTFIDSHLQKVLYLIGYGLQEEESGYYPFLQFCAVCSKYFIIQKLEDLAQNATTENHRDLLIWTINKYKVVQLKSSPIDVKMHDLNADDVNVNATNMNTADAEQTSLAEKEKNEKRARLAAERRAKIMAQMQMAQNKFIKSNAELFTDMRPSDELEEKTSATSMVWQDESSVNIEESEKNAVACLGLNRRIQYKDDEIMKCILCFEVCSMTDNTQALVYTAFVQKSKVLATDSNQLTSSIHASSCGHIMHMTCWQSYYSNEETRENRRPHRNRLYPMSSQINTEIQCPYCRCISNTVIPITPSQFNYSAMPHTKTNNVLTFYEWYELMDSLTQHLNEFQDVNCTKLNIDFLAYETLLNNRNIEKFEAMCQPIEKPTVSELWQTAIEHYIKLTKQYAPYNEITREKEHSLLIVWRSLVYTLQSYEMYMRATNKPFNKDISIRHDNCLNSLIKAGCFVSTNLNDQEILNIIPAISQILNTVINQETSCLNWNCFVMMAMTTFSIPNLLCHKTPKRILSNGTLMDFYILQFFFLINMVKAIVLFEAKPDNDEYSMDVDKDEEEYIKQLPATTIEIIANYYCKYNMPARKRLQKYKEQQNDGHNVDYNESMNDNEMQTRKKSIQIKDDCTKMDIESLTPDDENVKWNLNTIIQLFEHIKMEMYEFLRCSCVFYHYITDVDYLEELQSIGGDTYENMCKYLGLHTTIDAYFTDPLIMETILNKYASHTHIIDGILSPDCSVIYHKCDDHAQQEIAVVKCQHAIPRLIELPNDYSDLINSVSDVICPNNEREEMKMPTMCLKCGELLCAQSYCCQPELMGTNVGACTYHSNYCGGESSLFLRIRDCQIIYLGRFKGCFVAPPYLDEYGETDQGLRRGHPLYLCPTKYQQIHLQWLGHRLHEEIARLNDNTNIQTGGQWHHM